jgi:hypothetical protein
VVDAIKSFEKYHCYEFPLGIHPDNRRRVAIATQEAEMNPIIYRGESDDRKELRHEAET